ARLAGRSGPGVPRVRGRRAAAVPAARLAGAPRQAGWSGRLSFARDSHRRDQRDEAFMTGAMYPGTFDPITNGHHDLVRRAADIVGRVVVAIAANPGKAPLFTLDERVELAREVLSDLPNVEVTGYTGLTVEFARQHGLRVVVRGLRAVSDFDFE